MSSDGSPTSQGLLPSNRIAAQGRRPVGPCRRARGALRRVRQLGRRAETVPRALRVLRASGRAEGTGQAVAELALDFRGTPYRSGGADPSGFDCSGLVQYVFARRGLVVPRLVSDQFLAGQPVDRQGIAAGDLVFFRIDGQDVSHVGIAVGGGAFVHAPKARGVVRVESLDAAYWTARYAGARRIGGG